MPLRKVFVCGATGTQGSAVARRLRALNWDVHTITRDLNSRAAQDLKSLGVTVFQGTWSDDATLTSALAGCDSLFLNLARDSADPSSELRHGQSLLRLARSAGVTQVVYSSAALMSATEKYPFFQAMFASKRALEEEVKVTGLRYWTIQRPGYFMANLHRPKMDMVYPGAADTGLFEMAFRPDTELPMIDHEDIGRYAVAAFQHPERFHAQEMDTFSDVVRVERAIEAMRRGTGRDIRARYLTEEEVKAAAAKNLALIAQEVLRDSPAPSIERVREDAERWGVEINTFEQYVEREKKSFEETYQKVEKL